VIPNMDDQLHKCRFMDNQISWVRSPPKSRWSSVIRAGVESQDGRIYAHAHNIGMRNFSVMTNLRSGCTLSHQCRC